MENDILLPARYGLVHKLIPLGNNLWQLKFDKNSTGTYRIIGNMNDIKAIDPEGGPFLSVGESLGTYVIKSIKANGIFELENTSNDIKNENS